MISSSANGVHQPELIDIDRHAARGFADAEIVEGMERVGPELDAGADLTRLTRPFQYQRDDHLLRQGKAVAGPRCRRRR